MTRPPCRILRGLAICFCAALAGGGSGGCTVAKSANGDFLATTANYGFTIDRISESDSGTRGIPLLGGSYANDDLGEAREAAAAPVSGITVGSISLTGVVDHSTPMDTLGKWTWRTVRSVVTGKVFIEGIQGYFGNEAAKTAAATAQNADKLSAGVETTRIKESAGLVKAVGVPGEVPIKAVSGP